MNFDASRFQYMSFIATICIMSTMVLPAIMPIESIMLIMPIMPIITSVSSKETELSFLEIDITHHMPDTGSVLALLMF